MSRTELSLTEAQLKALLTLEPRFASPLERATFGRIRQAIAAFARAPKSSAVRKTEKKRRTKRVETEKIRAELLSRAGAFCECCGKAFTAMDPPELDHFFGRGKTPQTARNCWLIHRNCHRAKTNNQPSAAWWLVQFVGWAKSRGYVAEAEKARARLEALEMQP